IGAGETVRGGEHQAAQRPTGGSTARIADAGNGASGVFHGKRDVGQLSRRRDRRIEKVVVGDLAGQQLAVGEPGIRILAGGLDQPRGTVGQVGLVEDLVHQMVSGKAPDLWFADRQGKYFARSCHAKPYLRGTARGKSVPQGLMPIGTSPSSSRAAPLPRR